MHWGLMFNHLQTQYHFWPSCSQNILQPYFKGTETYNSVLNVHIHYKWNAHISYFNGYFSWYFLSFILVWLLCILFFFCLLMHCNMTFLSGFILCQILLNVCRPLLMLAAGWLWYITYARPTYTAATNIRNSLLVVFMDHRHLNMWLFC